MSDPEDGPWDDATAHDDSEPFDSEQMDGEDPPTTRATLAQQVRMRAQSRGAPQPVATTKPRGAAGGSTLPPPSSPDRLPAAATGSPATKPSADASPAATATNWPVSRSPAGAPAEASLTRPGDEVTPVALPAIQEANLRKSRDEDATSPGMLPAPPEAKRPPDEPVILLDKKRPAATPAVGVPIRPEGGLAVVAGGLDAEHVRKLCRSKGLEITIVPSIAEAPTGAALVVIGEPSPPIPDGVTHIVRASVTDEAMHDLLASLASGIPIAPAPAAAADVHPRLSEVAQRMSTLDDRGAVEMVAIEAVTALTEADRAQVLYFDPRTGALWSEAKQREHGDSRRASTGIVGWSAYTGHAVHTSPAGDDPRYLTAIDDPEGKAQTRLLVQPVIGADRRTHAVLVAARRWRRPDFSETDRVALRSLAARIATTIDRVVATQGSAPGKRTTLTGITAAKLASDVAALLAKPSTAAAPAPATDSVNRTTAASDPGRARSTSDAPRSRRRTGDPDPHDVAVIATAEDDIERVRRIARKARLEVQVMSGPDEVPPYYRIVTVGEAWTPDSDPRVAYAARSTITDEQLSELLQGVAHDRAPSPLVPVRPQSAAEAKRVQLAVTSARQLGTMADLAAVETRATAAVRELLDADRAYCLYYTPETGALWSETRRRAAGDDRRAIAGVVGWAVRTGRVARVSRGSADPRWLGPLDDPDGDPNGQLLAQPMIAADRRVLGALVAIRRPKRAPFADLDVVVLEQFAALAGPFVEQLQLTMETEQLLGEASAIADDPVLDSPVKALMRRLHALPHWAYAVGGAALVLLIVLIATC